MKSDDLEHQLINLRMNHLAANLDDFISRATTSRMSPRDLIREIVAAEYRERSDRTTARRLQESKVGHFKDMTDFDWTWPKEIDKEAVDRLFTLQFLEESTNVILAGPEGVGKSMIARNLAHRAVMTGHTAFVTTASKLVIDLGQQDSARALERRIRAYLRPDLLVIDELGYLSFESRAADLLFEIITRRHETGSIVLTTNLSFKDWAAIFPGATCVVAMIDRVTHCAEVIPIDAESYRRRESMEKSQSRKKNAMKGRKNEKS